ncbi:mechanosensitive ion channel family protein [Polynucleobacter rarus]|uniref:mechanosensitive ion channel family protein n=1 Tax=Polynucleobacter rarus TaxID=556055 RepID=UPI000D3E3B34|nr:mechanosensitive ion channel family protein [Polynucleobacter rarus]
MKNPFIHFLKKFELEAYVEWLDFIFIVLDLTIVLFVAWFILRITKKIILSIEMKMSENSSLDDAKRIQTLSRVMRYITSVVVFSLSVMTVLSTLGIPVAPLLATAGVAGVAIGFGAQSLVKDYFTGFVMLIENQIRQGDVVEIAGKIGTVEEVTLRYIRLRDYEGVVHFVPNNAITVVTNRSRNFLYAVMDISVAYNTDLAHLNQTLRNVTKEMREDPKFVNIILDDLEIAGLDNFGESSIVVRCRIKVDTSSQMLVKREFQGRLKMAFEQEGIEIPFRHLVILQPTIKTPSIT